MKINGATIRAFRELEGMTGAELAREIGISPQYLSDIESGRRNAKPALIRQLAQTFGVRIAAIVRDPEKVS